MQGLDRLIDKLFEYLEALQCWTVIDEYEQAVILRCGKYHRTVGKGLHFVWPLGVESIWNDNIVPSPLDTGGQDLTTNDDVALNISFNMMWCIDDIKKLTLNVEGRESVLTTIVHASVADVVVKSDWEEVGNAAFMKKVKSRVTKRAEKYGISITDLAISGLVKVKPFRLIQE